MSARPEVSVLLANWNGDRFLHQAVQSVVKQTYSDWELIAVDTGSEDNSCEVLEQWARRDQRIKPMLVPECLACPHALNLGLARCSAPLIARIESDDVWHTERLARQVAWLKDPIRADVGVCGSDVWLIDEAGLLMALKRYPRTDTECRRVIWYRNPLCHSAVLVRRAVFDTCGGYDARFTYGEDLELWFRVARRWQLNNLPESLVNYRVWPGSLTSRKLRRLAWLSLQIRRKGARELGCGMPLLSKLYGTAGLVSGLLPPMLMRQFFGWDVGRIAGGHRGDRDPGGADVAGAGGGQSQGAVDPLSEQSAAARDGGADVRG
jgi:glycosyltransferase involved in cell wall biosynthesis